MRLKYFAGLILAIGLFSCNSDTPKENPSDNSSSPAETPATPQTVDKISPEAAKAIQQAGQAPTVPDISELDFSNAEWGFGFNYDKGTWTALPQSQLPAITEFTATFSKRTPAFKMLGGLVLKGNAGKAMQYPVVTIGIEPLEREAPTLEGIRQQSGAQFLSEPNLSDFWPAHLESAKFPRPLVDRRRQAFFATSVGNLPSGDAIQVMQAIFIRPEKFIFLQMACKQEDRQRFAKDFAAMADSLSEQGE